jgi:hypothetical protein
MVLNQEPSYERGNAAKHGFTSHVSDPHTSGERPS